MSDAPSVTPEQGREERIAAIKARLEKTTSGPWWPGPYYKSDIHNRNGRVGETGIIRGDQGIADAAFIAAAREDIPWLLEQVSPSLSRVRALEAALHELQVTVLGECPSLLNEDSGGNAELDLRIRQLLAGTEPSSTRALEEENERLRKAIEESIGLLTDPPDLEVDHEVIGLLRAALSPPKAATSEGE